MIDKTIIVVVDGANVNPVLKRWLQDQPNGTLASEFCSWKSTDMYVCRLNRIIAEFLRTKYDWVLLLDADIYPTDDLNKLLVSSLDVAGCSYVGKDSRTVHPDGVPSGCLRISRAAAEKIGAPWFSIEVTPDGESLIDCPCESFTKRAKAAGYLPVNIGSVGHLIPMVVLPAGDKEQQIAIRFPAQYDLSKEIRV